MATVNEPIPFVWTCEAYEQAADAGIFGDLRVELIEGEVVQMSPMGSRHTTATEDAADALKAAFGSGFYVRSQAPLRLGGRSLPEPDVAVVRGTRDEYRRRHPETAELVVEISEKTLAFDRRNKAKMYATAMIPEYWIINLVEDQIEIFRKPDGNGLYAEIQVAKPGEIISPLGAPGAVLKVEELIR